MRNNRVSVLASIGASILASAALSLAAGGAFAADKPVTGMTSNGGGRGHGATAQPTTSCPKGQSWDAATKTCVTTRHVNNTTTRSNTQHN